MFKQVLPFMRGRLPGQLIIQFSNLCNANCPQCGMRRTTLMQRKAMSSDKVKALIDTAAERGVQALSLTGGEPLLYLDELVEFIQHARKAGIPYVRTGTNGYIFTGHEKPNFEKRIHDVASRLSDSGLHSFWISIDSAKAEAHEQMRGLKGIVKGIEKGLPIFHAHNIYPSANLGINRNSGGVDQRLYQEDLDEGLFTELFSSAFEKFYRFILDLGFTTSSACYPMSQGDDTCQDQINSSYGAISSDRVIHFSPREKGLIFQSLAQTIPKFRKDLRIFTPLCSLHSLIEHYLGATPPLYSCSGGKDFFFVDSDTEQIRPCGYLDATFPDLPDLKKKQNSSHDCNLCDWECFKDPSDLMGPFAEFFNSPLQLAAKVRKNRKFYKLLWKDLAYYRACKFFDGTLPPDYNALRAFS